MSFLDFPNEGKQINRPQEKPLNYWEEQSYITAVSNNNDRIDFDGIFDRVEAVEGITIKQKQNFTADQRILGSVVADYYGEEFEISFYYDNFENRSIYGMDMTSLSKNEIYAIKNAKMSLTVFMHFNKNALKSYHLQIKFILAAMPDLAAVYDESAEKIISGRQIRLYAKSDILPTALFSIQFINSREKGGGAWLHTHGLCRCGLTELEILKSCGKCAEIHAKMINTLAVRLLEKGSRHRAYRIGKFGNEMPIVVTYVPWTEALEEYNAFDLGGYRDRENGHNSRTSVIFAYKNERDVFLDNYSKVNIYDELCESSDPVFFLSIEQTEKIRAISRERFEYVKKAWETLDCHVLIEIGFEIDEKYRQDAGKTEKEYIWFELVDIKEDSFTAKLAQNAYWVDDIHEGDIMELTVDDVTNWRIYTKKIAVNPENVYLLFDD